MPKRKLSDGDSNPTLPKKQKHWSLGLLSSMEDPQLLVFSDDLVTIIKDKFPKAQYHYLVIPKISLDHLKSVTKEHTNLLEHMEKVALDLVRNEKHKNRTFQLGYHAQPSMARVHLHVISDDFSSIYLKNKKHWNSFTTDFFLKSEDVVKSLKEKGKLDLPSRELCTRYLKTPLKCNKCKINEIMTLNMPELKKHLQTHFKQ